MGKLISLFTLIAFVVSATIAPVVSHAMSQDVSKQEIKLSVAKVPDCHQNKAENTSKAGHKKHCDKGMCKCIGGTCFNGLSKMFNNSGISISALTKSDLHFRLADENHDSAASEGLKRPPRA